MNEAITQFNAWLGAHINHVGKAYIEDDLNLLVFYLRQREEDPATTVTVAFAASEAESDPNLGLHAFKTLHTMLKHNKENK